MQSYFGHIFLPNDDDFQKIEGVRLFMDGDDFWIEASINLLGVEKYNLIKGAFTGLGYVSLLECNVRGASIGIGGSEGKLNVKYIICGIQIDNVEDLFFSSLSIIMPTLRTWLNKRIFNEVNIFENNLSLFKHNPIDLGSFEKFNLEIGFYLTQSLGRDTGLAVNDFVTLKIKANSKLSLWEFLEVYKKFKKFLAFIGVYDKNPDFFTFFDKDIKYENLDSLISMKFFMETYNFKNSGIDAVKFPKFDDLALDINMILQAWFKNIDLSDSIDLLLDRYFQTRISNHIAFLNSCFSIEIFHRRYRQTGKELYFQPRLKELKEEFLLVLPERIEFYKFIKKVVDSRNYIAHRTPKDETFSGLELYYASIYIETVTKLCIFKELGFNPLILSQMFINSGHTIDNMFQFNNRLQTGLKKLNK
ncbi:ApeA N-terminal domain 1-containing protein [Flavobacterium nackdongense]|uniref:Uncharacterized protein n=1 Tax=Flavobacterium nackdongense TaxID=2547394 RepID=A0A4P6YG29_9FLAO|nr:HEPN domain-containing protein [Flavobacterium nackdongense]QBN19767.1 hypothetical protein E1750_13460 [Flavobacterium nackdongense]